MQKQKRKKTSSQKYNYYHAGGQKHSSLTASPASPIINLKTDSADLHRQSGIDFHETVKAKASRKVSSSRISNSFLSLEWKGN